MTTPRNPTNRVQPPDDLGPPEREVFVTLAHLAGRAAALRGVRLHPGHALLLSRIAQVVVLSRQRAEAGRLADAVALRRPGARAGG